MSSKGHTKQTMPLLVPKGSRCLFEVLSSEQFLWRSNTSPQRDLLKKPQISNSSKRVQGAQTPSLTSVLLHKLKSTQCISNQQVEKMKGSQYVISEKEGKDVLLSILLSAWDSHNGAYLKVVRVKSFGSPYRSYHCYKN